MERSRENKKSKNEIASFGATVIIIYLILHKNHNAIFNVTFFIFKKQVIERHRWEGGVHYQDTIRRMDV